MFTSFLFSFGVVTQVFPGFRLPETSGPGSGVPGHVGAFSMGQRQRRFASAREVGDAGDALRLPEEVGDLDAVTGGWWGLWGAGSVWFFGEEV